MSRTIVIAKNYVSRLRTITVLPTHDVKPTSRIEDSALNGVSVSLPLMSKEQKRGQKECKDQRMGRSAVKCYLLM